MKPFPKVKCPTCGKRGDWFSGPFGPFCSRRCKLVDLGKWLNEEYVVSEPLQPEQAPHLAEGQPNPGPSPASEATPDRPEGQP